jgi:hypothetical protein
MDKKYLEGQVEKLKEMTEIAYRHCLQEMACFASVLTELEDIKYNMKRKAEEERKCDK